MRLAIVGGRVYDPLVGWEGQERDLFIEAGRLVAELPTVDQVINARGLVVTPAALEIRSPVAGFGTNLLRLWGGLPAPRKLGQTYALLGYTHIHEPCLTLTTAGYVHRELAAIPVVDTSASLMLNLRDFDLWLRDPAKEAEVAAAWAFLQEHTRAMDLRVVEPFVRFRQDVYRPRTLTVPAAVSRLLAVAAQRRLRLTLEATPELLAMDLPVVPGLHLGGLGPALADDRLVDRALEHLAAGLPGDMGLLPPAAPAGLPSVPVQIDLGWWQPFQPLPPLDPAAARRALRLALAGRSASLAFSVASCVLTPPDSFPRLYGWLGDAASRRHDWGEDLDASAYTFSDWLRATRTLPARHLGLPDRGHLQPGARADLALYDLPVAGTWPAKCRRCRLLLKAGTVVVSNYELVQPEVAKATLYRPTRAEANKLVAELYQFRSFRPENLHVRTLDGVTWQRVS